LIQVLYHTFTQAPSVTEMEGLAAVLPQKLHESIFKFLKDEDKFKAMVGKLMLLHFAEQLGYSADWLNQLSTNYYGKPSLPNFPAFNISHTDGMIVCTLASKPDTILGIDTEMVRPIEMKHFESCFNEQEWANIQGAESPLQLFYQYWTMKESFIKADGRGLSLEPIQVITADDMKSAWEKGKRQQWYFHALSLHPHYQTHLCLAHPEEDIICNVFEV